MIDDMIDPAYVRQISQKVPAGYVLDSSVSVISSDELEHFSNCASPLSLNQLYLWKFKLDFPSSSYTGTSSDSEKGCVAAAAGVRWMGRSPQCRDLIRRLSLSANSRRVPIRGTTRII